MNAPHRGRQILTLPLLHPSTSASIHPHVHTGPLLFAFLFALVLSLHPVHAGPQAPPRTDIWTGTPIELLLPVPSGPGLVVCEPVADITALADLGSGCGRWLHLMAAGQPELDKTPDWTAITRAEKELGRTDLRLTPAQAAKLAGILGATCAATGSITGTPEACTLTYQLWEIPSLKAVGKPLSIQGTASELAQKLPSLAAQIAAQLGVAAPRIPQEMDLQSPDLAFVGGIPWTPMVGIAHKDCERLGVLAAKSPLAALLYLLCPDACFYRSDWSTEGTPFWFVNDPDAWARESAVDSKLDALLAHAPDNSLALSILLHLNAKTAKSHADTIKGSLQHFPTNGNFLRAKIFLDEGLVERHRGDERLVRAVPGDPAGWVMLSQMLSETADWVRQARTIDKISPDEMAFLHKIYPSCIHADQTAVRLDPLYGAGWESLAVDGSFGGQDDVADDAFWKAAKLDCGTWSLYWWGLEMYQPKWRSDGVEKIGKVAALAAQDDTFYPWTALEIINMVRRQGYVEQARQLGQRMVPKFQQMVRDDPDEALPHHGLATALERAGMLPEAVHEMGIVVRIEPKYALNLAHLGDVLVKAGSYDAAIKTEREALAMQPDLDIALYYLGYAFMLAGQYDDAEKNLRKAIEKRSDYSPYHLALAELLICKHDVPAAIKEYCSAAQYWNDNELIKVRLAERLCQKGDFDTARNWISAAQHLDPDDGIAQIVLGAALAHKRPPASILEPALPPW